MDHDDTVRRHPHITKEFLEWQQRSTWPAEHSSEYLEARKRVGWAPGFTAIGKVRNMGMTLYALTVMAGGATVLYAMLTGSAGVW